MLTACLQLVAAPNRFGIVFPDLRKGTNIREAYLQSRLVRAARRCDILLRDVIEVHLRFPRYAPRSLTRFTYDEKHYCGQSPREFSTCLLVWHNVAAELREVVDSPSRLSFLPRHHAHVDSVSRSSTISLRRLRRDAAPHRPSTALAAIQRAVHAFRFCSMKVSSACRQDSGEFVVDIVLAYIVDASRFRSPLSSN